MTAVMPPLSTHLPERLFKARPSGDPLEFLQLRSMTAVPQSIPAFLLGQAYEEPRSSGDVARQHASALSD